MPDTTRTPRDPPPRGRNRPSRRLKAGTPKPPVLDSPRRDELLVWTGVGIVCAVLALFLPHTRGLFLSSTAEPLYRSASGPLWSDNAPQALLTLFFILLTAFCLRLLCNHRSRMPAVAVGGIPLFAGIVFALFALKEALDANAVRGALGEGGYSVSVELSTGFWCYVVSAGCLIVCGARGVASVMGGPASLRIAATSRRRVASVMGGPAPPRRGSARRTPERALSRRARRYVLLWTWFGIACGLIAAATPVLRLRSTRQGMSLETISKGSVVVLIALLAMSGLSQTIKLGTREARERALFAVGGVPLLSGITLLELWVSLAFAVMGPEEADSSLSAFRAEAGFWLLLACSFSLILGGATGTRAVTEMEPTAAQGPQRRPFARNAAHDAKDDIAALRARIARKEREAAARSRAKAEESSGVPSAPPAPQPVPRW